MANQQEKKRGRKKLWPVTADWKFFFEKSMHFMFLPSKIICL